MVAIIEINSKLTHTDGPRNGSLKEIRNIKILTYLKLLSQYLVFI